MGEVEQERENKGNDLNCKSTIVREEGGRAGERGKKVGRRGEGVGRKEGEGGGV